MQKNILLLSALFCASAYSMSNEVIKKIVCTVDASGNKLFTNQDGAAVDIAPGCRAIEDPSGPWDEGACLIKKNGAFFVKLKTATRNGTSGYMINKQVGPFASMNEANLFLVKVPRENGKFVCDVVYRTATGRVVATNLNSEKEIYSVELPLAEGDQEEKLLLSENGDVVVVGKDGAAFAWSHRERKEKLTK